jgi:diguanylate cyclase (GGDEF)-like protein
MLCCGAAAADAFSILSAGPDQPLGRYAAFMKEDGKPLTLEQAGAAQAAGKFSPGRSTILTFGIGPRPVWVHLAAANPTEEPLPRRLLVENSWLDHLDVYFMQEGQLLDQYHVGDSRPYPERPVHERFFAFDQNFEPGVTDIYLRIETDDPIVAPVYLLTAEQAAHKQMGEGYSYGFLYGYLLALLCYNLFIFIGLRNKANLLYAVFIAVFILMNIAYTGHGFAWLWPQQVTLQRWIIPSMMVAYGITGLLFARHFLDTRANHPRFDKTVARICGLFVLFVAGGIALHNQLYVLLAAFVFVTFFTCTMLTVGVLSFRSGYRYSRYFLFASIASMAGATTTDLAVWGYIPFNEWTYRAVEIGMLVDATLLALALTYQIRSLQLEHKLAEQRAARDPLTGLDNRRSFLEKALPAWSTAQRNQRDLSAILLDLDHFKSINDQHGHAMGDQALMATARVLADSAREGDIVSRWGGEEFLLLLPETRLEAALIMAERLQKRIAAIQLQSREGEIRMTASFGVAQKDLHENLDSLIADADRHLYRAKAGGRNRISSALG